MKVTFVLPDSSQDPIGGHRVVYEYANGLVARGHEVAVLLAPLGRRGERSPSTAARRGAVFVRRRLGLKGGYRPDKWFRVDPRVRIRWAPDLHPRWAPDSDVVVATGWPTTEWVGAYPERKGRKFYLIQHQESTFGSVEPNRVMETWRLPLKKIVISKWLGDIAVELGEDATYIPNGLDFDDFGLDIPISERSPHELLMLHSGVEWKGSRQGLEAMSLVRREVPQLKATVFDIMDRPEHLPDWVSYLRNPARGQLREAYNRAAIFVGPSWMEGWGLPPCEAAQCGAALCLTDVGGHREYAIHGQTALLSPPKNPEALAANIKKLIEDGELRTRLAAQGHEYVRRFTWDRAVSALERVFEENVN